MVPMFKWGSLIVAPSMKTTYVHRSLVAAVGGTFLRGVLDKVGVEPQVQRIGAYKSAGELLVHRRPTHGLATDNAAPCCPALHLSRTLTLLLATGIVSTQIGSI
jgi:hypothetical protein